MIRSYWYLVPVALAMGLATLGSSYGAPLTVVGLAFGIFFGTVSMRGRGRAPDATSSHPGL